MAELCSPIVLSYCVFSQSCDIYYKVRLKCVWLPCMLADPCKRTRSFSWQQINTAPVTHVLHVCRCACVLTEGSQLIHRHYRKRSSSRGRSGSRSKSRSPDKRSKKDDRSGNRDKDRNRKERSRSRDRRRSRSRDRKRPRSVFWVKCGGNKLMYCNNNMVYHCPSSTFVHVTLGIVCFILILPFVFIRRSRSRERRRSRSRERKRSTSRNRGRRSRSNSPSKSRKIDEK